MANNAKQGQREAYEDKVAQLRAEKARLRAELKKYNEDLRPSRLESEPPVADQEASVTAAPVERATNADLYLCKATGTPGTWKLIG
jgi:cell division protein FtsB